MQTYRRDVEGLRAVAVLLVLGDHLFGLPRGGYVGVDVFFVVSGFLITGLLLAEVERTGALRLGAFWVRRVRRLLPAALVTLAVTCLAASALFLPVRAAQTTRDALFAAVSAANWRFAALGTDYFATSRPASPVQHFWSLAVEEQFYAAWPLLLLGLTALGAARVRRRAGVAAAVVLVTSLAWSVHRTAVDPAGAYFSTGARAHELAAGALLAAVGARAGRVPARLAGALSTAGLLGVLATALLLRPGSPFPGATALLPVLATVAVLAGGVGGAPSPAATLLSTAPLRLVGRLSYSLYLVHWPVLVLAGALVPDPPAWQPVALLGVTLAVAWACHRLVEQPLRRPHRGAHGGARPRPVLPAVLAGALLVVAGTAATTVPAADGGASSSVAAVGRPDPGSTGVVLPPADAWRTVPDLRAAVRDGLSLTALGPLTPPLGALPAAAAPEWVHDGCLDVGPADETRCTYGPEDAPRTAVLLGDSVAISWLPGLRAALEPQGFRIHVLTRRQCSLGAPDDAVSPACRTHRVRALARAVALRPDLVVVSGSPTVGQRLLDVGDAPVWRTRMQALLSDLRAPERRVVVLAAPPQSGNLQSCVTRVGSPQDCVRPVRAVWTALGAAGRAAAAAVAVRFVDTTNWFCHDQRCPSTVGGTPVAFDGTHLTATESRRLSLLLRAAVT